MKDRLENTIKFVNDQIAFHKERSSLYAGSSRAKKHQETMSNLLDLKEFILELFADIEKKDDKPASKPKQLRLSLTPQDLDGLPDELLEELSISKADKVEYVILNAIEDLGGFANLDQLLVAIFRETGEVTKRTALTNRLYRMATRDQIYSVPDKKGVYSLEPMSTGELDRIMSESKEIKTLTKEERDLI